MKSRILTIAFIFVLVLLIPVLLEAQQAENNKRNTIDISYVFYNFTYIGYYESEMGVNYLSRLSYAITYQRSYLKNQLVSKHSIAYFVRDSYFGEPVPRHHPYFYSKSIIQNNAIVFEFKLTKKLFLQGGGNIEFRHVYERGNTLADYELFPRIMNQIGFGPELGIRYNISSCMSIFTDYNVIRNIHLYPNNEYWNDNPNLFRFHSAWRIGLGFSF